MAVYVFDYAAWSARYPSLAATVTSPLASAYFAEACLYLDNTDCSVVTDVKARGLMLNALVAHIAVLDGLGVGNTGLVGRITSATQGSVSVQASYGSGAEPGSKAWYTQTQYGASYWQMTQPYRSAMYFPAAPTAAQQIDYLERVASPWPQ